MAPKIPNFFVVSLRNPDDVAKAELLRPPQRD